MFEKNFLDASEFCTHCDGEFGHSIITAIHNNGNKYDFCQIQCMLSFMYDEGKRDRRVSAESVDAEWTPIQDIPDFDIAS